MRRFMQVTIGIKPEALKSESFDKDEVLAEAKAFKYAVGCMLNTVVPPDYEADVTFLEDSCLEVEISVPDSLKQVVISTALTLNPTMSEDDAYQNLWDRLGGYLQKVEDMVNTYGVHFGGNLLFSVNYL